MEKKQEKNDILQKLLQMKITQMILRFLKMLFHKLLVPRQALRGIGVNVNSDKTEFMFFFLFFSKDSIIFLLNCYLLKIKRPVRLPCYQKNVQGKD